MVLQRLDSSRKLVIGVTTRIIECIKRVSDKAKQNLGVSITERDPTKPNEAVEILTSDVQSASFKELINDLKRNKAGKFTALSPFLDDKGLIRAGGRLRLAK